MEILELMKEFGFEELTTKEFEDDFILLYRNICNSIFELLSTFNIELDDEVMGKISVVLDKLKISKLELYDTTPADDFLKETLNIDTVVDDTKIEDDIVMIVHSNYLQTFITTEHFEYLLAD